MMENLFFGRWLTAPCIHTKYSYYILIVYSTVYIFVYGWISSPALTSDLTVTWRPKVTILSELYSYTYDILHIHCTLRYTIDTLIWMWLRANSYVYMMLYATLIYVIYYHYIIHYYISYTIPHHTNVGISGRKSVHYPRHRPHLARLPLLRQLTPYRYP